MQENPRRGWIKPALLAGFLLLFLILGESPLGPLPPFGKFFDPFAGFWANADADRYRDAELSLPGLHEPVRVVFDKRRVPHIFAQNDRDLFYAQGYVTARDRLWQMEIGTQAAAGRLAEILGPKLLDRDRFQRRLGMLQSARGDLEAMRKDPLAWNAAEAYADGVNAFIAGLSRADLPIEYKLLDYAPEPWTPLKTALLVKNMQWTLSGGGDDLPLSNTLARMGPDFVRHFFPASDPSIEPVIPPGTPWGNVKDTSSVSASAPVDSLPLPTLPARRDPDNGSNNFVLAGTKTRSGYPILANDPHLDLSLPSTWYEIQLAAPGVNAYGVSLPGGPGVVIGFNKSIAWGLTNGSDDVFDWYRERFRDSTLAEYRHGKEWKPVRKVVEAIKVRGKGIVYDTVLWTHHGPVVLKSMEKPPDRNTPALHALRWLAHDPSDELQTLLLAMKASDYNEFSAAVRNFKCPSQNFAFASAGRVPGAGAPVAPTGGDIAMDHQGLFPLKWPGQGRFVLDGENPAHDWRGWIPMEENPRSKNPARGWLASANQSPTDSTYPHFLGADFLNGTRAKRLAQLVSEADSVDAAAALAILLDDKNLHAAEVLPVLLGKLKGAALSKNDSACLADLARWDYRHTPGKKAPALFEEWWTRLYRAIWKDDFGDDAEHYQWPSKSRTRRLILEEPDEDWFDDATTPARETLASLARRTFAEACATLRNTDATWAEYRPVNIRHLAFIDAFSRLKVATGGCGDCVNAQKTVHGPSWRMVVSLGHPNRGLGIYPGGQSGNPGSPHYDEFIADWAAGKAYDLLFLEEPGADGASSIQGEIVYRLLMKGK
jgi:penicillin amidase